MLLVLVGVTALTFFIAHAIPGNPGPVLAGQRASDEVVAQIRRTPGWTSPCPFSTPATWRGCCGGIWGVLSGRGGRWLDLARFFPATLELVGAAMLLAVVVGVPLGVVSAARHNSWVDHPSRGVCRGRRVDAPVLAGARGAGGAVRENGVAARIGAAVAFCCAAAARDGAVPC